MFIVVKSKTRKYGYSVKAPASVIWATGPDNTFGWYRRKSDAQQRADAMNIVASHRTVAGKYRGSLA
jgi:hypothetical protein